MDPASADKPARQESAISFRQAIDPRLLAPVWHVWIEDADPVGPVSAERIARGIRAGKVPSDASVRHDTDTFWTDLLDQADIVAALKAVSHESDVPPPPSVRESLSLAQYLVWIGDSDPVGPVSADQIARGIRAGKVPSDASIQRVGDLFASDVLDEPEVILALKQL